MAIHQNGHLVKAFDAELRNLHEGLLDMARAVRRKLDDMGDALVNLNAQAASEVVARDAEINDWEVRLDAFMETLISRRQPQAIDLRMLLGCSRMTNDFERMGDEIRNAAKGVRRLSGPGADLAGASREEIGALLKAHALLHVMSDDMIACCEAMDVSRARALLERRSVVSSEVSAALHDTIADMKAGEVPLDTGLELIRINRALERVAAHMQNIGEAVVFAVEGLDIRHEAPLAA